MTGTILAGLVVTVFGTLVAIWLDRWLLRGKREEARLKAEKEKRLEQIGRMQETTHELLRLLEQGADVHLERDRFERVWRVVKKSIQSEEQAKLNAAFQNACSGLSMGTSGCEHSKRMLRDFQNELEGLFRRVDK